MIDTRRDYCMNVAQKQENVQYMNLQTHASSPAHWPFDLRVNACLEPAGDLGLPLQNLVMTAEAIFLLELGQTNIQTHRRNRALATSWLLPGNYCRK